MNVKPLKPKSSDGTFMTCARCKKMPFFAIIIGVALSCSERQGADKNHVKHNEEAIAAEEHNEEEAQMLRAFKLKEKAMKEQHQALAKQERSRNDALSKWIEENFDKISRKLGHYYCFESARRNTSKAKLGSIPITAIITERMTVFRTSRWRNGKAFAETSYEIKAKIVSPKKYYGKRIHIGAWRSHPGSRPSWMNGSETGNLVEFTIDKEHLKRKEWDTPLKLSLSTVNVSRHWALCVLPEIEVLKSGEESEAHASK